MNSLYYIDMYVWIYFCVLQSCSNLDSISLSICLIKCESVSKSVCLPLSICPSVRPHHYSYWNSYRTFGLSVITFNDLIFSLSCWPRLTSSLKQSFHTCHLSSTCFSPAHSIITSLNTMSLYPPFSSHATARFYFPQGIYSWQQLNYWILKSSSSVVFSFALSPFLEQVDGYTALSPQGSLDKWKSGFHLNNPTHC